MERRRVEKSLQDGAFRQRLLADPRAAVEPGTRLPEGLLILTLTVVLTAIGCSGGGHDESGRDDKGEVENGTAESTKPLIGSDLGHQAFQPSTRLVIPGGVGT